jgi:hypothetical protein
MKWFWNKKEGHCVCNLKLDTIMRRINFLEQRVTLHYVDVHEQLKKLEFTDDEHTKWLIDTRKSIDLSIETALSMSDIEDCIEDFCGAISRLKSRIEALEKKGGKKK